MNIIFFLLYQQRPPLKKNLAVKAKTLSWMSNSRPLIMADAYLLAQPEAGNLPGSISFTNHCLASPILVIFYLILWLEGMQGDAARSLFCNKCSYNMCRSKYYRYVKICCEMVTLPSFQSYQSVLARRSSVQDGRQSYPSAVKQTISRSFLSIWSISPVAG